VARGKRVIPEETKRQCFILYDELQSYSAVGKELDLAPNTVKSTLLRQGNIEKYKPLLHSIAVIKENSNKKLLDILLSDKYKNTTELALGKLDSDTLDFEINKNGIRSLIALIGNSFDKTIAYEKLQLDKRKVDIAERTLELKETELQARIDNPEAFNNIVIVKDTDEIAMQYQEESRQDYARD